MTTNSQGTYVLIRPFSTFHSPFVFVYIAKSLFTKQYSLEQIEEKLVPTVATNWREISEFTSQFVKDSRIEMQILKFLQTGSRLSSKELNGNNTPFYLEGADVSLNPNARANQGAVLFLFSAHRSKQEFGTGLDHTLRP